MQLFDVYGKVDVTIEKALGCHLWDPKGEKYLDLYGGHAVISIGHRHPDFEAALIAQIQAIGYYSNAINIPQQQQLADALGDLCGYPDYHLFLCNSGAEAVENACKVASFHNGRRKMVSFSNGFHGRTSWAVALTDNPSIQAPINQTDHIITLPFNQEAGLEENITPDVTAVIIEGIQGIGGIHRPDDRFMQKIRSLCDQTGALLIIDEIQSGYGRTGQFFAHQQFNVQADIITMAKGMGNGFPIGGVLIKQDIPARQGMLGTTFGGNHLACQAALSVLKVIKEENLMDHARAMGIYLMQQLGEIPQIKAVRGQGLMLAIDLHQPASAVRRDLLFQHRIFTGAANSAETIRLLPPLTITPVDLDQFITALKTVLNAG